MPLDIRPIPDAVGRVWRAIPTTCHMATLYWLHDAELRRLETQNEYLSAFSNPTIIMTDMLAHGRKLSKPLLSDIQLAPGTVIIFSMNGQALHSCVASNHHTISGYNQVNWFNTVGVDHGHSVHSVADLKWTGLRNNRVDGNTQRNSPCQLFAIEESTAKAFVRQLIQQPSIA